MKRGFTLVEMIVAVGIFAFLFGAIFNVQMISNRSWSTGQNKLFEQQEARRTMDSIVMPLRQSNPEWIIGIDHYPLAISSENNRIDFYQPVFDLSGNISALKKVTFKLNPDNERQLLKKVGTSDYVLIANDIESIYFGGGCSNCSAFDCSVVAANCPMVMVEVKTKKNAEFTLMSKVTLRNQNITLPQDTEIEQPEEGEF